MAKRRLDAALQKSESPTLKIRAWGTRKDDGVRARYCTVIDRFIVRVAPAIVAVA